MRILELEFEKSVDCCAAVAWWNYWDHEHLDVVHSGYQSCDILYERDNYLFRVDTLSIPVFSFLPIKTIIFQVQHTAETMLVYAFQMGVLSLSSFRIKDTEQDQCHITMNYKFFLSGWSLILYPLLKWLVPKWNRRVWDEDLSLKLRRQKVMRLNFKDFAGLPREIGARSFEGPIKFVPPVIRPKHSSRDRHPFKNGGSGFRSS